MTYRVINDKLITYLKSRLEHLEKFTSLMKLELIDEDENILHEANLLKVIIKELERVDKQYTQLAEYLKLGDDNSE